MNYVDARVHINLEAIAQNLFHAATVTGARVMAVIKANAYGHGAVEVARYLGDRANAFAVARLDEAMELRASGVSQPIVLLEGVFDDDAMRKVQDYSLQLVVHTAEQLHLLEGYPDVQAWLKVDTGMGRLGFSPGEFPAALEKLKTPQCLGVMSHLADADDPSQPKTTEQAELFSRLSEDCKLPLSLANSAGILAHPVSYFDWVRPGLMLYGASPLGTSLPALEVVSRFTAPVIAVRDLNAGDSVGYGSTWTATEACRIAVIAAGYADGYPREVAPGTLVGIGGERRELVGRVSMDMLTVKLADKDRIRVGDQVELWGETVAIEEVALQAGTIAYTLMCGIAPRVQRVYGKV